MNKTINNKFKLLYLFLYISYGVFFPYANVYYSRLGLDGVKIGFISSISVIVSMVFIPLWGILAGKYSNRRILSILCFFSALSVFLWCHQSIFPLLCLLSVCIYIFKTDLGSICDSLSVEYCNKYKMSFGQLRSYGSFGYIVGSTFIAIIMNKLGYSGPYVFFYILSLLLCCVIITTLPKNESVSKEAIKEDTNTKSILRDKRFLVIVLVTLFTNTTVDTLTTFAGIHITETLHCSDNMIGIATFIMVIPELYVVNNGSAFIKKVGYHRAFIISCISVVSRCLICFLTRNIYVFILAQSLHGVLAISAIVGNIEYLNKIYGGASIARALTLLQTFNMIYQAVLSQTFGFMMKYFGTFNLYLLGTMISVAALIIVLTNKKIFE